MPDQIVVELHTATRIVGTEALQRKCSHHIFTRSFFLPSNSMMKPKSWERLLEEIDFSVNCKPCPRNGGFIACATMHCLVRSQPFSCPLLLILQRKPTGKIKATFPFALSQERSKNSIFNQWRRSFQSQQSNCVVLSFSSSKAGKIGYIQIPHYYK